MALSNLKIAYYRNLLLSMKVASYKGAPVIAKPVFMLTIIQMIEEGTLLGNKITFTDELCSTYSTLFQKYSTGKITPVIYPFYYLNSEEFYIIKGDTSRRTPSVSFIQKQIEFAALDDEFWELLQDPVVRNDYREAIIKKFLT